MRRRLWALTFLFVLAPQRSPFATTGLVPLDELGPRTYLGFPGGLYPRSQSRMPPVHALAGAVRSEAIERLDTNGVPSPGGRVALLAIGMCNPMQELCSSDGLAPCNGWTFIGQSLTDPEVDHSALALVNGARPGQTADKWDSPTDPNYDRVRDVDLAAQGLSEAQVQAVWVKVAHAHPTSSLPNTDADAYSLEDQMGGVARALRVRYPHLQLVFFSSRIYGGYATTTLNPEPFAYELGLAVKWLVQAQIDQMANGGVIVDPRAGDLNYDTVAPWIAWGPYMWANGTTTRCDGLMWERADFEDDGTHPTTSGETKVGTMMRTFFKTDPRTRRWFLALGDTSIAPTSGLSAGGAGVTISGKGFAVGAAVTIGGAAATGVVVVNDMEIEAAAPALAPGTLNDVVIVNPDGVASTIPQGFLADFLDVDDSHPFHAYVETLVRSGATAGCDTGIFCPEASVTRAEMAVFLLKSPYGSCFVPPAATGSVFGDVGAGDFAAAWIEQLASLGVTSGCGNGNYCPDEPVTRAQMAVFLLKALLGSAYAPPAATGIFQDVPVGAFAADWIEDLYRRGITGGCGTDPLRYCPDDPNTRGQMAVFLTKTFALE